MLIDDISVLLAGDSESEVEMHMLSNASELDVDVLKISHHGSKSSSIQKFLFAVSPSFAVIQAGENNQFDHPHEETLRKLEQIQDLEIYRTDKDGTVEFSW